MSLLACGCEPDSAAAQALCAVPCADALPRPSGTCKRARATAAAADCGDPKQPPDTPGTDHGCIVGTSWCGSGGYDPTQYSSCASAAGSSACKRFPLRFGGTGLCLSRGRWAVVAAACDAADALQQWLFSHDGTLLGQGVASGSAAYQGFYYTAGMLRDGDATLLALQDPAGADAFTALTFLPQPDNRVHVALGPAASPSRCIAAGATLGSPLRLAAIGADCAAMELL
jgi:hypothetical protein